MTAREGRDREPIPWDIQVVYRSRHIAALEHALILKATITEFCVIVVKKKKEGGREDDGKAQPPGRKLLRTHSEMWMMAALPRIMMPMAPRHVQRRLTAGQLLVSYSGVLLRQSREREKKVLHKVARLSRLVRPCHLISEGVENSGNRPRAL